MNLPSSSSSSSVDDDQDMSKVVQSISSCTSIDQYMLVGGKDQDQHQQPNDYQLLSMISEHIRIMRLKPYVDEKIHHISPMNIDIAMLNGIKKQIEACFELDPPAPRLHHPTGTAQDSSLLSGKLMSLHINECSLFSGAHSQWTPTKGIFMRPVNGASSSLVYAHGNLYLFGGMTFMAHTYSWYSLAAKTVHHAGIFGVSGGSSITAFYDGDKYIYLVGGYNKETDKYLNRVDRFNIHTHLFSHVGNIPPVMIYSDAFLHNNVIYSISTKKITTLIPSPYQNTLYNLANGFYFKTMTMSMIVPTLAYATFEIELTTRSMVIIIIQSLNK
ncbi:hypothetical protein SAMD00019534_071840 [Acytostelium subglobosum LB1]|uniref:hypothetical protein n=1 Tax=Acytostelium subglobosum LB1 TaxID=1410327 RepID=UPI000644877F|nr:hypothetical protein SAMD00019534_071840 [Acytostelium subglobosum LB1]GAM24009.1 hypothetical protein SAMD00019534_071840 [Acytostelium subglobosum LB1]|eukprot:XP_012753045.1 hypothetical protein SAMD00019534_071840 [Acytostelium subglobosum LB1]